MSTKIIPPSFAPGADAGMLTARAAAGVEPCPGCRRSPLAECSGCGGEVAVVLPAGVHSMPLCIRCYALLREIRAEARNERGALSQAKRPPRKKQATRKRGAAA